MFIDIHAHAYRRPYPGANGKATFSTPHQLLKRYEELGIERAVLLPLVSPEVYLPQSNEDILEICEESNGRFIPFCNIDPRAIANSCDAPLGYILRYYRECGCKGIGEVLPNMEFSDPKLHNLLRHVQDVGFPFVFDATGRKNTWYGLYDEPGLPQLEDCLRKFPRIAFLGHGPAFWAEIGQLEKPADRQGYPAYPIKEEGVVPKLMRRYPNLYGDLSAGSGANALMRDPSYAVQFMTEFQDRLLFGTDICAHDTPVPLADFLLSLRKDGRIDEKVFQKIARENAIKLLDL